MWRLPGRALSQATQVRRLWAGDGLRQGLTATRAQSKGQLGSPTRNYPGPSRPKEVGGERMGGHLSSWMIKFGEVTLEHIAE